MLHYPREPRSSLGLRDTGSGRANVETGRSNNPKTVAEAVVTVTRPLARAGSGPSKGSRTNHRQLLQAAHEAGLGMPASRAVVSLIRQITGTPAVRVRESGLSRHSLHCSFGLDMMQILHRL
ncbi:hypothetical protein BaRGS_00003068, partial [Batillaria attramentaria]